MINIKYKEVPSFSLSVPSIRYNYPCPYCGGDVIFFYYSPEVCKLCTKDLPEVGKLFTNEDFKKLWHRGKTTIFS